jgi:CRP-like cAMP-binding protein
MPRELSATEHESKTRFYLIHCFPNAFPKTVEGLVHCAFVKLFVRGERVPFVDVEYAIALVLGGRIGLARVVADGHQAIATLSGAGSIIALPSADRQDVGLQLVAVTDGAAVVWSHNSLRPYLESDCGFGTDLVAQILADESRVLQAFDALAFASSEIRLTRLLLTHDDLAFNGRSPVMTRQFMADSIGVSREMVTRHLRSLEARGVVARVGRRGLVLLDRDKLAAVARRQRVVRRT